MQTLTGKHSPGADPGLLRRFLEDCQKSKYSIRTVRFMRVTLIEQSNNV